MNESYPKTEIGESFLVNAEWHGSRCASNRTGMYRDCDCTLIREIVALETEAAAGAFREGYAAAQANADQLLGDRIAIALAAERDRILSLIQTDSVGRISNASDLLAALEGKP